MIDWFVSSGGSSIYLEEDGSGRPVLALHGLGGGAYFFRGLAGRLHGARVVSVDLPGTGWSTTGGGRFSIDSWVDDLADLLRGRVGEPAVVLGHSMGTMVALELFRRAPELVAGLIFANGLPRVRPGIRERLSERADRVAQDGLRGWGARVSPGIFSAATLRRRPEVVALFERLFEAQHAATYVHWTRLLLDASVEPLVLTTSCPCAAITGSDDQYAPPDAVEGFIRQLPTPADLTILPEVGHMPFFEAPDVFAQAVDASLKKFEVRR